MTDPLVVFTPSGRRGRFPVGTPILDAARELGVYVESVCGGRGICGRCQVQLQTGQFAKHGITSDPDNISPWSAKEERYCEKRGHLKDDRRLSCSATVQGDLVIDIPADASVNRQIVRKDADTTVFERNPALQLCYVEVEEPDMHKPLGDLDRLKEALEKEWGWENLLVDHHLMAECQKILRDGDWKVTAAIHLDLEHNRPCLTALWPGLKNEAYGVACDFFPD